MEYDVDGDFYICVAGRKLSVVGTKNKKSKSGFNSVITIYRCETVVIVLIKINVVKLKEINSYM